MEGVLTMTASSPSSRFFNREMEKTPSPEKDDKEQGVEKEVFGARESFADEIEAIDARFQVAFEELSEIKRREEDGKMVKLVSPFYVYTLMKFPPRTTPLSDSSVKATGRRAISEEDKIIAEGLRASQMALDIKNDIIRQYRQRGYAYIELDDN